MAGSIFLTDEGGTVSRLRLLYVKPVFQGRGIGDALVSSCIAFARSVGYERITLWTHTILESASRIYARHGASKGIGAGIAKAYARTSTVKPPGASK